jgi:hypothetical protein
MLPFVLSEAMSAGGLISSIQDIKAWSALF